MNKSVASSLAIVAILLAAAIGGAYLNGMQDSSKKPVAWTPPSEEGIDEAGMKEIRENKWWSRIITPFDLNTMIDKVIAMNASEIAYIDEYGSMAVMPELRYGKHSRYMFGQKIQGLSMRRLHVDAGTLKRPTKSQVIIMIKVAVDAAEFRDGPSK